MQDLPLAAVCARRLIRALGLKSCIRQKYLYFGAGSEMTYETIASLGMNQVRVADVEAGVNLASQWLRDGKATYFRGQTFPWPPRSSLARWRDSSNAGNTLTRRAMLDRYFDWLEQYPALSYLSDKTDHALAIAQHFGIPTDLIDFTDSPVVAGLFSRDRPQSAEFESPDACIFCLDYEAVYDWITEQSPDDVQAMQFYPVLLEIPRLHRLTAQRGLFFHAPGEWYRKIPMSCIVFRRGPTLTDVERLLLYPPTSRLEEDLLKFLRSNEAAEWAEYIDELSPESVIRMRPPPGEEMLACFNDGEPKPTQNWPGPGSEWLSGSYAPFGGCVTIRFPRQTEKMGNVMLAAALTYQLGETLEANPSLNDCRIQLEIESKPGVLEEDDAQAVSQRITRAWNAMAEYPYTLAHRLACMEVMILRGSTGMGIWRSDRDKVLHRMKIGKELLWKRENADRWCEIALGAVTGTATEAIVCLGELVGALDPNLPYSLSPVGEKLFSENPLELMRRVRDPKLLFDFDLLTTCFVQYLIPTQLLLHDENAPIIFSPSELNYLGPA